MVIRVADLAARVISNDHIYIATDDTRIGDVAASYGYQVIYTSSSCMTGTDRLAEATKSLNYDYYINIQGDEPLLDPADIQACIDLKLQYPTRIINCYTKLSHEDDPYSLNIPKVVVDSSSRLLYISRSPIPGFKENLEFPDITYHKQVCIYAFGSDELSFFASFNHKAKYESLEDIEILRFLEHGFYIHMHYCANASLAVDTPDDLERVLTFMGNEN